MSRNGRPAEPGRDHCSAPVSGEAGRVLMVGAGLAGEPAILTVRLAGQVTISAHGRALDARRLFGRQGRLVLAMLILERHRSISRDELAESLWPAGPPRTWKPAVRGAISNVRKYLAAVGLPDSISFDGAYQLLVPCAVEVDIESAQIAAVAARRSLNEGQTDRAVVSAEHALGIVAQPFMADSHGTWIDEQRMLLRGVRLEANSVLAEAYANRGMHALALRQVECALTLEPFREQTYRLLMRIHMAAGSPAEAVRAYHRCRDFLSDELGVEPGTETTALYLCLLRSLSAGGRASVGGADR